VFEFARLEIRYNIPFFEKIFDFLDFKLEFIFKCAILYKVTRKTERKLKMKTKNDFMVNARRTWVISPVSRVKNSKKVYSRKNFKIKNEDF
jgi:hypothetical protein